MTNKNYSVEDEKIRVKKAGQRRTTGFFIEKKFYNNNVLRTLESNGCNLDNVKRYLVAWKFDEDAKETLESKDITCITMGAIFQELANVLANETSDLDSDILRTIQLFVRSKPEMPEIRSVQSVRKKKLRRTKLYQS